MLKYIKKSQGEEFAVPHFIGIFMSPLFATGLVEVGRELVSSITGSKKPEESSVSFDRYLNPSQKIDASDEMTIDQIQNKLRELVEQLKNDPEVKQFLNSALNSTNIEVSKDSTGAFLLETESGEKLTVQENSPLKHVISEIYDLKNREWNQKQNLHFSTSINQQRPNSWIL